MGTAKQDLMAAIDAGVAANLAKGMTGRTPSAGDSSTLLSTTAFVSAAIDEEKTAREKVAEELAGLGFTVVDGALCQILEE